MDNEWIPVTKRLPDCGKYGFSESVLITYEIKGVRCVATAALERMEVRGKSVMQWRTAFYGKLLNLEVVSWMPLPKPYEGE